MQNGVGVLYKKLVTLLVGSTLLGTAATGPFLPPQIPAVDVRAFRGTDGKLRMLIVSLLPRFSVRTHTPRQRILIAPGASLTMVSRVGLLAGK